MKPTPVWILNKSNQNPPGQPGGGSPGEGYVKCVQSLEPILRWFIECMASASENDIRWERVGKAESVENHEKHGNWQSYQKSDK